MRRRPGRSRPRQIDILQTNTRKGPSRQHYAQFGFWTAVVLAMLVAVGFALHLGIGVLLNRALFENPRYTLQKIEIKPEKFSQYTIKQAAGLEPGQTNLWSLNLPQIKRDVEKLPYVSSATIERHFPDRVAIRIVERVPVVKIFAINDDIGSREMFYLDRECVVLKPRDNEPPPSPPLPEVIGLVNAEVEPGVRLEQPALTKALQILEAINHISTLNTSIDIRTIDLSQPLAIRMETTRDMVITFRLDYIEQQLARLDTILNRFSSDARTIKTVDLTPDRYVPVTFYE
jgi:cell division septal protein FtsQ